MLRGFSVYLPHILQPHYPVAICFPSQFGENKSSITKLSRCGCLHTYPIGAWSCVLSSSTCETIASNHSIVHQHASRERVYVCTCNRSDGNRKKLMWDDDSSPALWSESKLLVQGTRSNFLLAGLLVLVKINQHGSSTNMWCSNVLSSEPQHSYWHWESCLHLHPAHMPRNFSDS